MCIIDSTFHSMGRTDKMKLVSLFMKKGDGVKNNDYLKLILIVWLPVAVLIVIYAIIWSSKYIWVRIEYGSARTNYTSCIEREKQREAELRAEYNKSLESSNEFGTSLSDEQKNKLKEIVERYGTGVGGDGISEPTPSFSKVSSCTSPEIKLGWLPSLSK